MKNIKEILSYFPAWDTITYSQDLVRVSKGYPDEVLLLCKKAFFLLGIADKVMSGTSASRLPYIEEGEYGLIYSKIFWDACEKGYLSPVSYAVHVIMMCLCKNIKDEKVVAGIVGRGLRAFPSFLRELYLQYKLSLLFPEAKFEHTVDIDINDHADILMRGLDCNHYIWSYCASGRGTVNAGQKILGKRGALKKGNHVLCPLINSGKSSTTISGWWLYSDSYIYQIAKMISFENPETYEQVRMLSETALNAYLKTPRLFKVSG